ncbi:MAG: homoserine dehydrogenase [Deltaproteobacteria bacterium]|nr:homoserine dehydrogenase [Deltaproteobacteria bacterium]
MKQVSIALLGCGQVGTGLVKLLQQQRNFIERRTGIRLRIKRILVRDSAKKRQVRISGITDNIRHILDDKDIDIAVELIGGIEPARSYILKLLQSGKHVVTANKAVLAHYGSEIQEIAQRIGREVYYESAVCAGVPVIRSIKEGLLANRISLLMGILNGTTNYILSRMSEEGISLNNGLKQAQQYGFAEPDPAIDLQGIDTAHKLNILASLSFAIKVRPQDIYTEGITGIELEDIKNANEFGYVIKLLAIAREIGRNKLELKVHPAMIPKVHPLAAVRNEFNALYLHGNAVGEMMFYGKGAGAMPTASAILSDIIELCTKSLTYSHQLSHFPNAWGHKRIISMDETVSLHYLRFPIVDKPGVIGKIATILGNHNISIYGATASLVPVKKALGNVRVLTKKAKESEIKRAISEINRLPIMRGRAVIIRIEE